MHATPWPVYQLSGHHPQAACWHTNNERCPIQVRCGIRNF